MHALKYEKTSRTVKMGQMKGQASPIHFGSIQNWLPREKKKKWKAHRNTFPRTFLQHPNIFHSGASLARYSL